MVRRRSICRLLLALAVPVLVAGCSGRTTGATAISQQPNGTFSAQLNAVGSCDTTCTAFTRWRVVGTSAWTESARFTVGQVTNAPWSRTATGLFPRAPYEYQACGRESAQSQFVCVGPDGTPATTQRFLASRKFVYTAGTSQFAASDSGHLTPLSPPTVETTGSAWGVAVSLNGMSAYVANPDTDKVDQYDVGSGGGLTAKGAGAVTTAGRFPSEVTVHPDGRSVYVALDLETGLEVDKIAQFDAAADGTLTPKSPAAVGGPVRPLGLAVSPDGRSLYASSNNSNVVQYDIDQAGKLMFKSPAFVPAGADPRDVVVSPDGRSVYVTDHFGDNVHQYDVTSGGRLAPKDPATVPTSGSEPWGIAITPDGTSVYVANEASTQLGSLVSQFTVGAGGRLTPKSPAFVGSASDNSMDIAVSADGKSVYVANVGSGGDVSQFSVGSGGKLSLKSPATVDAEGGVWNLAVTP